MPRLDRFLMALLGCRLEARQFCFAAKSDNNSWCAYLARSVQWARLARADSRATHWSRASAGSHARPVQRARLLRAFRVAGCSGPDTRSITGSRGQWPGRGGGPGPARRPSR